MGLTRKLIACGALTAASASVYAYGTSRQVECFNGVKNDYSIDSLNDLPEKVMNDSGCFSLINTLGVFGMAGGITTTIILVGGEIWRRRKQEGDETDEQEEGRVPVTRPADCIGEACVYFTGQACESRYDLLEVRGDVGKKGTTPAIEDCNYAFYGQVCTVNETEVIVGGLTLSPNGQAGTAELIALSGRWESLIASHTLTYTP